MGFFQNLTGWHALILLAVVLLLFGAAKLPALARSAGQSMRIFRSEIKDPDASGERSRKASETETGVVAASSSACAPATLPGRDAAALGGGSASA
ncbi:twin-arginine translocase TatA/TatE family subunit [Cnuibacter physcomitrellae]|uniref:twin-arginine translocase TatA/TatE family subunit n=1 Tax=Cnuibacter physcomitrellae TaxID=1619308 RepID=UPI0028775461|nr:twin-arginine translocase TatA/TatE family subunit [Cnuibacter physcomitrellae]